ncbi:MAG: hypothetical protein WAM14_20845 [Candidatus Nitrosopolaris sp.]
MNYQAKNIANKFIGPFYVFLLGQRMLTTDEAQELVPLVEQQRNLFWKHYQRGNLGRIVKDA